MFFTAYGDGMRDVTWAPCESARRTASGWQLQSVAGVAGLVSTIDLARVADPEDYRIAWNLWQQVWPLRRKLINECFDAVETRVVAKSAGCGLP